MLAYLLTLAEESDKNKIEHLYKRFHGDMLRLARYQFQKSGVKGDVHSLAEDAVQNSFLKLIRYIDKIDFEKGERSVKIYVLSVVLNECVSLIKDVKNVADIDEDPSFLADTSFFERLLIKERYDTVIRIIEKMDERYSTVLLYFYRHEMTAKEIAHLMGLSPKTVYTRLERGKKLLLARIEQENI